MSALIEEVFNKINTHKCIEVNLKQNKNIQGIILCDYEGIPIKTTFTDEQITYFYSTSASIFIQRLRDVVKTLVNEGLSFIRIRTKQNEIMIAPGIDFIN